MCRHGPAGRRLPSGSGAFRATAPSISGRHWATIQAGSRLEPPSASQIDGNWSSGRASQRRGQLGILPPPAPGQGKQVRLLPPAIRRHGRPASAVHARHDLGPGTPTQASPFQNRCSILDPHGPPPRRSPPAPPAVRPQPVHGRSVMVHSPRPPIHTGSAGYPRRSHQSPHLVVWHQTRPRHLVFAALTTPHPRRNVGRVARPSETPIEPVADPPFPISKGPPRGPRQTMRRKASQLRTNPPTGSSRVSRWHRGSHAR